MAFARWTPGSVVLGNDVCMQLRGQSRRVCSNVERPAGAAVGCAERLEARARRVRSCRCARRLAVPLSDVQSTRRAALLRHDAAQEQLAGQKAAGKACIGKELAAQQHHFYTRTKPLDLRTVRPVARLGRRVFLARC